MMEIALDANSDCSDDVNRDSINHMKGPCQRLIHCMKGLCQSFRHFWTTRLGVMLFGLIVDSAIWTLAWLCATACPTDAACAVGWQFAVLGLQLCGLMFSVR